MADRTHVTDIHVTYTDSFGTNSSQSFDVEEYEEELFTLDSVIKELTAEGASTIIFTIGTEEDEEDDEPGQSLAEYNYERTQEGNR